MNYFEQMIVWYERNKQILADREAGMSIKDITIKYGISRARAYKVISGLQGHEKARQINK